MTDREILHQAALQAAAAHRESETALVLARRDRISLPLNDVYARQIADDACLSAQSARDSAEACRVVAYAAYGRSF